MRILLLFSIKMHVGNNYCEPEVDEVEEDDY